MPRMSTTRLPARFTIVLLTLLLGACGRPELPAAPAGEYAVLEQLAEAYKEKLQQYPTGPRSMRPEGRKQFIDEVFRQAGYDYEATLASLAAEIDPADKNQRDLAELISLPFHGLSEAAIDELYSGEARENIRRLQQRLR